jgi:hypothetical protein
MSISLLSMGASSAADVGLDHYLSLRYLECNAKSYCNASAVQI